MCGTNPGRTCPLQECQHQGTFSMPLRTLRKMPLLCRGEARMASWVLWRGLKLLVQWWHWTLGEQECHASSSVAQHDREATGWRGLKLQSWWHCSCCAHCSYWCFVAACINFTFCCSWHFCLLGNGKGWCVRTRRQAKCEVGNLTRRKRITKLIYILVTNELRYKMNDLL